MTKEEIVQCALEEGFADAAIIDTSDIVFDASFRPYCEENLCGKYGANYSCPPDCGTPEEMRQKIMQYKYALVLRTVWEVPDFRDKTVIKHTKGEHNASTIRLVKKIREDGHDGLIVGASSCTLCSPCAITKGEPCKFPELRFSCMSAYCIYVKKLSETCGMKYDYENELLPFFGMYVFD